MLTPRVRYRIGKRYVASPKKRLVEAELWRGKRKTKVLGQVRSKRSANALLARYLVTSTHGISPQIKTRYKRWDRAAEQLAKRAIAAGLTRGGKYQLSVGRTSSIVYKTKGGSSMRSIASRRKGATSLAEEIAREMFRLAKLSMGKARLTYREFLTFVLSRFRLQVLRMHRRIPIEHPIAKSSASGRSTRKTTVKAKRFSHVSRGTAKPAKRVKKKARIVRRVKSKHRRSTAKNGKRR